MQLAHGAGHRAQRARARARDPHADGLEHPVDEAMFLGGLDKGEFLREFQPDFFFDDQTRARASRRRSTCRPAMCRMASPTK